MKKRYMFTLTKGTVEEFQALCKEAGLPPSTLSREVDRFVKEMLVVVKKARAQGSFTVRDMIYMMADQVELALEEGAANDKKRKEESAERS